MSLSAKGNAIYGKGPPRILGEFEKEEVSSGRCQQIFSLNKSLSTNLTELPW